jgi:hypothetical protein
MDFQKIAPYLHDPLILIGFFLFLAFLFARGLLHRGIIPPLPPGLGFRILKIVLLYGFVIGLVLLLLGFGLRYRELLGQERRERAERDLKQKQIDQEDRNRKERIQREARLAELKRQEQQHTVSLLQGELKANLHTVEELEKNTATLLSLLDALAKSCRIPGARIMATLFPAENLEGKSQVTALSLADRAMNALGQQGLDKDELEGRKFSSAATAMVGTIDRTIATARSLADVGGTRYVVRSDMWKTNLPILREISGVDVTVFQRGYTSVQSLRTQYDILVRRVIDYMEALKEFLAPTDHVINRQTVAKVLAAERLAWQIATAYGSQLVANGAELKRLGKALPEKAAERPSQADVVDAFAVVGSQESYSSVTAESLTERF